MKALSIHSPWWWFIFHGKDIENRSWFPKHRGTLAIHASKAWDEIDVQIDLNEGEIIMRRMGIDTPLPTLTALKEAGGHIVGLVDVAKCTSESSSPWFFGPHDLVLRKPQLLKKPVPCRGMPGIFDVPEDVRREIAA